MIKVIKNTMEYQFTEPDNHDPVDSVDFGRMCAIFEDGTGEVVFESEEIDKAEEYFNAIPKPVAKWNSDKKTYTVEFYEIEDEDGEVSIKAPFIGYRMYYQQQEPQFDDSGKVVGYKDRGWASYRNLPEYMSIKDFISSTTCYLPTRKDCNAKISLYDGDRNLIEEQMLFADDLFNKSSDVVVIPKSIRRAFEEHISKHIRSDCKKNLKDKPLRDRTLNKDDILSTCKVIFDSGIIFRSFNKTDRNHDIDLILNNLAVEVNKYFTERQIDTQNDFDIFHTDLCRGFMQKFNYIKGITKIQYGSAQKMVNMLFKYLTCFSDYEQHADKFVFCHIPIDNYILQAFKEKYGVSNIKSNRYKTKKNKVKVQNYYLRNGLSISWTKLSEDDYKALVADYRNAIKLNKKTYLGLEFELWEEGIGY